MELRLFLHPGSGARASRKLSQPSFATDPFRVPASSVTLNGEVKETIYPASGESEELACAVLFWRMTPVWSTK